MKHAIDTWPPIAALPLRDLYAAAEPARVRLWAACDLLEMLARLMVVLGIAEVAASGEGRLPPDLLRELFGLIEEPTLGAWQGMAEAVARRVKEIKAPSSGNCRTWSSGSADCCRAASRATGGTRRTRCSRCATPSPMVAASARGALRGCSNCGSRSSTN